MQFQLFISFVLRTLIATGYSSIHRVCALEPILVASGTAVGIDMSDHEVICTHTAVIPMHTSPHIYPHCYVQSGGIVYVAGTVTHNSLVVEIFHIGPLTQRMQYAELLPAIIVLFSCH